jgi:hypothetical protein
MEKLKPIMTVIAVLWPLVVCLILTCRLAKNSPTDWKLASCLSALTVLASLLLLLASEKLQFLRYQDAVLQVNQRADEVQKLTDLNKRLAKITARGFIAGRIGAQPIAGSMISDDLAKVLTEMLREAGASSRETEEIFAGVRGVKMAP